MGTHDSYLQVQDSRTSESYTIPIRDNAVEATHFKKIKTENGVGLKVYDEGLANTATLRSSLTFQ